MSCGCEGVKLKLGLPNLISILKESLLTKLQFMSLPMLLLHPSKDFLCAWVCVCV